MSVTIKKQDGDLVRMGSGRFKLVRNEEKLAQDVGDMLMTEYDAARGVGSELITKAKNLANPGVMDIFGDAFLAKIIEDGVDRLRNMQEQDPRNVPTERIDPESVQVVIRRIKKKEFLFFLTLKPVSGTSRAIPYRVKLRHQYPGQAAVQVFPAGIVTDDMVP